MEKSRYIPEEKRIPLAQKHWLALAIVGFCVIIVFGIFRQIINFNNQMISLQELKKAEIETTKVEYGQCIVKILETNQIAKSYRDDVLNLASKAGSNLEQFSRQLLALVGTQVVPQLTPDLRLNVQHEIISCRNSYTGRVDLSLKPMYVNFNRMQLQFPNSIYNSLFFRWKPEELNVPKSEASQDIFDTGKIKTLDLQ